MVQLVAHTAYYYIQECACKLFVSSCIYKIRWNADETENKLKKFEKKKKF